MTEFISSPENKLIKEVTSLKQKKYRDSLGMFTAEGVRLVEECINTGWPVEVCIFTETAAARERTSRLIEKIAKTNCKMVSVPENIYNKISDTEQPQGIMVILKKQSASIESMISGNNPNQTLLVIIDSIQDPGNTGTIIRTADAAGCNGVIVLKGSADIYASKTVRATMGSLFHFPILEGLSPSELIPMLKHAGIIVMATGLHKSCSYYQADFNKPVAIILGNEGQGVSTELLEAADTCLTIPLVGQAESLNVAVAAGIILYEAVRQRSTCNL